jgi:dTDP-4-amino-4,6-dideoxygalactose transaminase
MIPVFRPLLNDLEIESSRNVLEVGWLGMGKNVGDFEEAISKFLGLQDRYAVAVSTGHAALHLALLTMNIGPGDEVITPSFNNAADFQAILAVGADPVLCDIDSETLNIDIEKAEKLITKNTKAIIVMDYDCILCDHDRINWLAAKYGIRVLHDAAHSFGSKYKNKMVGSFSDMTMFSFDPVKTITCLDGGILIVKDEKEVSRLHEMRLVGMGQPASVMYKNTRAWTYDMTSLGFRYHMSNMHAAIGLAQLSKMELIEKTRRETCRFYNAELSQLKSIKVPNTDFSDVVPFLYYIRVPAEHRDALRKHLLEKGVDTGIHWQPGHWFTLLKNAKQGDLSITDIVGHEILSLPLHSCMSEQDMLRVVRSIQSFKFY